MRWDPQVLKFAIIIRIIVNLRPNFENFIRIIEIPLREFSGVLLGRYFFYFIAAWGDVYFLINFLKGKFLSDDGASFLDLKPI